MAKISVDEALALWQQAGLLNGAKTKELARYLEEQAPLRGSNRALQIFAGFGAVLVGLGLILFVASHWPGMSPRVRIMTLFCAYGFIVAMAVTTELKQYPRVAAALWLLVSLTLGVNIVLIGQLFNLSLTFWEAPLLWMIGALVMAYAVRSRLNAWLAVPLGLLALGWAGGGRGWFSDDQFEFLLSPAGIKALLPLLGLALLSLGLLVRRSAGWRFASGTWITWGALLMAVPLVSATVSVEALDWLFQIIPGLKHWLSMAVSVGLLAAALYFGALDDAKHKVLLASLGILLLALPLVSAMGIELDNYKTLFLLYPLTIFVLALVTVWLGAQAQQAGLINIGMGAAAVIILIQYFSWSFRLLDRSLAFLLGGVLLIVLALWSEHKRRNLIKGFAS
jgi:uncharacterized membrane protein